MGAQEEKPPATGLCTVTRFHKLLCSATDVIPGRFRSNKNVSFNLDPRVSINRPQRDADDIALVQAAQGRSTIATKPESPAILGLVLLNFIFALYPSKFACIVKSSKSRRPTAKRLKTTRTMA